MELPEELLVVLVCPDARTPLYYFPGDAGFLFCPESRRKYRVEQGIPVMLLDESERLSDADAEALTAEARSRGLRVTGAPGNANGG